MGRISFYDLRNQRYHEWDMLKKEISLARPPTRPTNPASVRPVKSVKTGFSVHPYHRIFSIRAGEAAPTKFLKNGSGWLNRDTDYENFFSDVHFNNAIYTLAYESEGSIWGHHKFEESWEARAGSNKLFAAGGPLQLSVCGSYAGLWSI